MDSAKKKMAISGDRKDIFLSRFLNSLKDSVISMIIQARLRRGTNTNRDRRKVNPPSMRLNPKIKSNLAPIIRIIGSWVKKIAMPLKIISFSPYGNIMIVRKHALSCLLYRITWKGFASQIVRSISSLHNF